MVTTTATPRTLSLHDALPIYSADPAGSAGSAGPLERPTQRSQAKADRRAALLDAAAGLFAERGFNGVSIDRKSTRLNSSHVRISYAVFCLKKKNQRMKTLL